METFVHATNPEAVPKEFFRVLAPGGSLAMYEYDTDIQTVPAGSSGDTINQFAAMPSNLPRGN